MTSTGWSNTRLLVQANSGGGKSWLLRRLLEQTHGHVQHLVIDPEGEFASLRERFDYVLAAKHGGDTAADAGSGASAWQPIETAPHGWDGTQLLLADEQGRINRGFWFGDPNDGHWVMISGQWEPTHWMKLPDPSAPTPTAEER